MKKELTRAVCLVISCVLFISIFIGCGTEQAPVNSQDSSSASSSDKASGEEASLPADPNELEWKSDISPVTLTAYVDFPQDKFNGWGNDDISKEIIKRTGVTIDLKTASTDDSQELNMMLASNDLPDYIIVIAGKPMRQVLWKQGFAQPLNNLIDKYCPKMWSIIPKEQKSIYSESDGNLYLLTDYFSDIERIAKLERPLINEGVFAINEKIWKDAGSPPMNTLDEYKAALLIIKEKFPEVKFPAYDQNFSVPQDVKTNMAQTINRLYGGTHLRAIGSDDTIHFNFRDESYKKAILYINDLYRSGLYNPENFTITNDEQYKDLVTNGKIFSQWGNTYLFYRFDMTENAINVPYDVPKADGITPKLANWVTGIGGWHSVHISTATRNAERAIKYLEFMISDEGQMLLNSGIEGVHYTIEEGLPKSTDEFREEAQNDWSIFTQKYGIYNYNIQWLTSTHTDQISYYWEYKNNKMIKYLIDVYTKYATNERINELIRVASDSDEKVIEIKISELWKTSLPKMYLAKTQEACLKAYDEFVKQAEGLGLAKLEAAYTADYKNWKAKIGN